MLSFVIVLFLFSVTIPKLTMLSFPAKMCFFMISHVKL